MPSTDVLRDPRDPYGRAKVGVKMSAEALRQPPPPPPAYRFIAYHDDVWMAYNDARAAQRIANEAIDEYNRLASISPEAAKTRAERDYGSGTTVDDAIGMLFSQREDARVFMQQIEEDPELREEDLYDLLSGKAVVPAERVRYAEAAERFRSLYGENHPIHTQWLISRSSTAAEMNLKVPRARATDTSGWCADGVWRLGDAPYVVVVDPKDSVLRKSVVDGSEILSVADLIQASHARLSKAAVMIAFYEKNSNEDRRGYWQHWMDIEVSALAQMIGIDYEFRVDPSAALPSARVVAGWAAELDLLESEDAAKLRQWEAVHSWACDEADEAEMREEEAQETRLWAQEKRQRVIRSGSRSRRHSLFPRRRAGARSRQSRGRSVQRRGSRRVSRSAGGSSSGDDPGGGDPEPGERPRLRLDYVAVLVGLALSLVLGGHAVSDVEAGETWPSLHAFELPAESQFPALHPGSRAEAEALLVDPRQFSQAGDDPWHKTDRDNWWMEVCEQILDRSGDADNPCESSLAENFGVSVAEFADKEVVDLLRAQIAGDLPTVTRYLDRMNRKAERSAVKHGWDCFDHFTARRLGSGEVRILMDQRHASRLHTGRQVGTKATTPRLARRRTAARARDSRGSSSRTRGSRRVTSRSASGGGSNDDPDPEPEALRASTTQYPRRWHMPSATVDRLLTAEELADRWQVPKPHMYRLWREGKLPFIALGRYWRAPLPTVEAYRLRPRVAA